MIASILDSGDPIEGTNTKNNLGDGNPQGSFAGDLSANPLVTSLQFFIGVQCVAPPFQLEGPYNSFLFDVGSVSPSPVTNPPNLVFNNIDPSTGAVFTDISHSYGLDVAGGYFVFSSALSVEAAMVLNPACPDPSSIGAESPFFGTGAAFIVGSSCKVINFVTWVKPGTYKFSISLGARNNGTILVGGAIGTVSIGGVVAANLTTNGVVQLGLDNTNPASFTGSYNIVVPAGGGFFTIDLSSLGIITTTNNITSITGAITAQIQFLHA